MVTAEREWREAFAEARRAYQPPSLLAAFNRLGIASHGLWFLLLPFVEYIDPYYRTWALTILAVPLLLGHLYLWDLRRRRRNE